MRSISKYCKWTDFTVFLKTTFCLACILRKPTRSHSPFAPAALNSTAMETEILTHVTGRADGAGEGGGTQLLGHSAEASSLDVKCLPIIRGEVVPDRALLQHDMAQLSFIHGIRHHEDYANLPEVVALCKDGRVPGSAAFTRARNARQIMSNIVPEILALEPSSNSPFPYCIWYPELATEDTYRQLAARYPCLKYQVGRACAVAGYTSLYKELDLLPDVSIAEEARASPKGNGIFEYIMGQPLRYAVLDDYTRTIRQPPVPRASLNDDTALASTLSWRTAPSRSFRKRYYTAYFDITEDGGIGHVDEGSRPNDEFTVSNRWLLYSPLPTDLPQVNKNLLILMAAHQGNVDRYARLKRPQMVENEMMCVVRGIYHSSPFAKWWSSQIQGKGLETFELASAAHARFIMMNDLSWHTPDIDESFLPYMIWYPVKPWEITLRALFKLEPRMRHQIAHATIACNYQAFYDELKAEPTEALLREASYSWNAHYTADLEARRHEMPTTRDYSQEPLDAWDTAAPDWQKEPTTVILFRAVGPDFIDHGNTGGLYQGTQPDVSTVNLFMCCSEEFIRKAELDEYGSIDVINEVEPE